MATLSITVPDTLVPRIMAALRASQPDLTGDLPGQTPLTDAQAFRAVIKSMLRQRVVHFEGGQVRTDVENRVTAAQQDAWTATEAIS